MNTITTRHFQPGLPAVTLEITRGGVRNHVRQVTRSVYFIGRSKDCDLVLDDPSFADVHACLLVAGSGVTIRHLGRAPHLKVNGKIILQAALEDQTLIATGPLEFRVHLRPPVSTFLDPNTALDSVARMVESMLCGKPLEAGGAAAVHADSAAAGLELSVGIPQDVDPPVWRHMSCRRAHTAAA